MAGRTPEPTGKDNAETMSYRAPAKPGVSGHGKPSGNAQTGAVEIVNFGDAPIGAEATSRSDVSAGRGHAAHRSQSTDVDAGKRGRGK